MLFEPYRASGKSSCIEVGCLENGLGLENGQLVVGGGLGAHGVSLHLRQGLVLGATKTLGQNATEEGSSGSEAELKQMRHRHADVGVARGELVHVVIPEVWARGGHEVPSIGA